MSYLLISLFLIVDVFSLIRQFNLQVANEKSVHSRVSSLDFLKKNLDHNRCCCRHTRHRSHVCLLFASIHSCITTLDVSLTGWVVDTLLFVSLAVTVDCFLSVVRFFGYLVFLFEWVVMKAWVACVLSCHQPKMAASRQHLWLVVINLPLFKGMRL